MNEWETFLFGVAEDLNSQGLELEARSLRKAVSFGVSTKTEFGLVCACILWWPPKMIDQAIERVGNDKT